MQSEQSFLNRSSIEQFLAALIDIPSITGNEAAVTDFLAEQLSSCGMTVRKLPVSENRHNLLAFFSENPSILLSTHCDTVPPFIPARIENGTVHGRGACDAKGMIAAMTFALLNLPEALQKHAGLLIVVGEETDSIGAKTAARGNIQPDFIINGEPTGNMPVRAQKGTFIFRLSANGKAAHSGYPHLGESAVARLLEQLDILRNLDWGTHPDLGESSFNIGTINGGSAPNIIPDNASAECCVRLVQDHHQAKRLLSAHLLPGIEIEIISDSDPLHLHVPDGMDSMVVPFGSDAAYLSQLAPVLMIGPGDIQKAHTADESIQIDELKEAVGIYQQLIMTLLDHKS